MGDPSTGSRHGHLNLLLFCPGEEPPISPSFEALTGSNRGSPPFPPPFFVGVWSWLCFSLFQRLGSTTVMGPFLTRWARLIFSFFDSDVLTKRFFPMERTLRCLLLVPTRCRFPSSRHGLDYAPAVFSPSLRCATAFRLVNPSHLFCLRGALGHTRPLKILFYTSAARSTRGSSTKRCGAPSKSLPI